MKVNTIQASRANSAVKRFRDAVSFSVETEKVVRPILADVLKRGDKAVFDWTEKLDKARIDSRTLRVTATEMKAGWQRISGSERKAIRKAIQSIKDYHKKCLPSDWTDQNRAGITIGERFYPITRVGLYVPGGRVPLVSTVLMTAVPAQVAGVKEIVLCTPPRKDGSVSDGLLAAFHALGLKEVYRIGGAQAIGAMAYGTKKITPVDMIAGPGNAYVMEAKRQVYGQVGIDLLPGPSEVMVIADEGATPEWVAADLLSQAEHGTGKEKLYLSVPTKAVWESIQKELEQQLSQTEDNGTMKAILRSRFLVGICPQTEDVVAFANAVAPEHLELQVDKSRITELTKKITTAGAILQGYDTPTVLGDFVAGPSHTLPTDGTGRFSGGLQAIDFMRRTSLVRSNPRANQMVLPTVEAFSSMESLPVHAGSLRLRTNAKKGRTS